MKWIRQSFDLFKADPRQSLYIAVISLGLLVVSSFLNFGGVWIASLGLIYLQAFLFLKLSRSGTNPNLPEIKRMPGHRSLILLSVFMVPTNMMMGTLMALAQGDQPWWILAVMIGGFTIICSCVYILIFHAVGFVILKNQNLGRAMDSALRGFHKNGRSLIGLGILLTLIFILGALPFGVGLVVALPLILYAYYFSFRSLYPETSDPL